MPRLVETQMIEVGGRMNAERGAGWYYLDTIVCPTLLVLDALAITTDNQLLSSER